MRPRRTSPGPAEVGRRVWFRGVRQVLVCLALGVTAAACGGLAPTTPADSGPTPTQAPVAGETRVQTPTSPAPTTVVVTPTTAVPVATTIPTVMPQPALTRVATRAPSPTMEPSPSPVATPTVAPPPATPSPAPTGPTASYSDPQLGVSFSYPEEWAIDVSNPTLVRLRPPTPSGTVAVGVQSNLTGPTSLDSQRNQLLRSLASSTLNVIRVTPKDDVPHDIIEAQWTADGSRRKAVFVVAVRGARVHSLGVIGREDFYEENRADIEAMIASFRTISTAEPAAIDIETGVDAVLDDIGARAGALRVLPYPSGFTRALQPREEFEASDEVAGLTPEDPSVLKDLCLILDLCVETDDLSQTILDLTSGGVLGYYKPEDDSLTLVTGAQGPDPLTWLTYAHEYTHALQDRAFDLSALEPLAVSFESSKGIAALVEGDAKLVENLFYETLPLEQQAMVQGALDRAIEEFADSIHGAPRIITETFGWEHVAGAQFAFRLYLSGGFAAIDDAFARPPTSTEQVLHPEKYLAGEVPVPVDVPPVARALGTGWTEQDSGVLGELRTKVYLDTFLRAELAAGAAAGWGGDRYTLLKNGGGELVLAVRFLWDTPADAREFFLAYQDAAVIKGKGQWDVYEQTENLVIWSGEGTAVYLSMAGEETVLVIGPDPDVVIAAGLATSASSGE